jgi:hypothetical protein
MIHMIYLQKQAHGRRQWNAFIAGKCQHFVVVHHGVHALQNKNPSDNVSSIDFRQRTPKQYFDHRHTVLKVYNMWVITFMKHAINLWHE